MGVILILLSAIFFVGGFANGITTVQQQTVQYLGFVCGTILFSSGFVSLVIQFTKKNDYYDEFDKISKSLKIITDHITMLEDEKKAEAQRRKRENDSQKDEISISNRV